MELTFANPAGLWALLALPAVLAIHFLQRESRRIVTSTFFLFEQLTPVSAPGQRFERLRGSLPLFLQLAAVLLLTWLLVGPRWVRRESTQRVVVVLDSSVSMLAFRDAALQALQNRLPTLARSAGTTEWRVFETGPAQPTLYAGTDLRAALASLARWQPRLGTHDFSPALRTAQGLAHESGVALFVTDRRTDLPDGVSTLAVGHPLGNCGFAGVSVENGAWHALVKNNAGTPQTRAWQLVSGGATSPPETLTLQPGQTRTLNGSFPAGQDRCELVLSADEFSLDDHLPVIRPLAKRLRISVPAGTLLDDFLARLAASIPDADAITEGADVRFTVNDSAESGSVIVFTAQEAPAAIYLPGDLVAENDPLTAHLSWNGLLVRDTRPLPRRPGDEVLLWQGGRPLIFLRGDEANRSLFINFDLRQSNADRLPAFVVLLNRFVEMIRAAKVAPEHLNVETNARLVVATEPGKGSLSISLDNANSPSRAPVRPGFFTVAQGTNLLLTGAASFADPREADFRDAATMDTTGEKSARLVERHSRIDFLAPVWALLLGVLCLWNWSATGSGRW